MPSFLLSFLFALSLLSLSSSSVDLPLSAERVRSIVRESKREETDAEARLSGLVVASNVSWCVANTDCDQSTVESGMYIDFTVSVAYTAGSLGTATALLLFTPDTRSRLVSGSVSTTAANADIFSGNEENDVDVIVSFGTVGAETDTAEVTFRVRVVNTVDGYLLLNEEVSAMVFQVPGGTRTFVVPLSPVSPSIVFTGEFSGSCVLSPLSVFASVLVAAASLVL